MFSEKCDLIKQIKMCLRKLRRAPCHTTEMATNSYLLIDKRYIESLQFPNELFKCESYFEAATQGLKSKTFLVWLWTQFLEIKNLK